MAPNLAEEILADARSVLVDDLKGPIIPIQEGEDEICILSKNLRGLWYITNKLEIECDRLSEMISRKKTKDDPLSQSTVTELSNARLRHVMAKSMLIINCLYQDVPIKHHLDDLEIREGWKIVSTPTPPLPAS